MNQPTSRGRRQFVLGVATLVTGAALAGCLGNGDDDDGNSANDIDDHLSDANGYDGTIEDLTGETAVTIGVGDPQGGTNYMFQPVAAEIDAGTTVTWEWVDEVGHSVTHSNGNDFDSGIQEEFTFEHTFEDTGTYLYHCIPHRAIGHLGALVVV